jgi:hypothetical protein
MFPFNKLSNKARKTDILPGLKPPLMSMNKMAKEGYTTVFHPGKEGVTVHKPGTFKILTTDKPVLTRSNLKGLWPVTTNENEPKEKANHAYSIPSTEGKIRFLHAAAGFPTKETWLKTIKAGNYLIWLGVTAKTINRHFPNQKKGQKAT